MKYNNMKKLCSVIIIVVAAAGVALYSHFLRREVERLRANNEALTESVLIYRTRLGSSAASVGALRLTLGELRTQHEDALNEIRELRIRLRNVESYARSVATTTYRDTLILNTIDSTKSALPTREFRYADAWLNLSGLIWGDTLKVEMQSRDTLHQVIHRIPRRFLGIPFGIKSLRQEISSSNPHTQLIYSEYLTIERRLRRKSK